MLVPNNVDLPQEYDVVSCEHCGFTFANVHSIQGRALTQKDYDYYYTYNNNYGVDMLKKYFVELNSFRLNLCKKYILPTDYIADIGCGDGELLLTFKKAGMLNLKGIDPSDASVKLVKSKGLNAENGSIFQNTQNQKFDFIMVTGVLEHIFDLPGAIESLKNWLNGKGSKIYAEVPDITIIDNSNAPVADHFNCEHINYFSIETLDLLFGIHGFKRISLNEEYRFSTRTDRKDTIIGGVYEFSDQLKLDIKKDLISQQSIEAYFTTNQNQIKKKYEQLQQMIAQEKNIIIWGCGNYTLQLLAEAPAILDKISFFIDSNINKQGKYLKDIPILAPDSLTNNNLPVIICTINGGKDIEQECKKRNIRYWVF